MLAEFCNYCRLFLPLFTINCNSIFPHQQKNYSYCATKTVAVTVHGLAPLHALLQPQLRKVGFSLGGGIPQIRYYSLNLFDGRMSLRFKAYAGLRHRRSRRDFYI